MIKEKMMSEYLEFILIRNISQYLIYGVYSAQKLFKIHSYEYLTTHTLKYVFWN